jgi:hypothetical protein
MIGPLTLTIGGCDVSQQASFAGIFVLLIGLARDDRTTQLSKQLPDHIVIRAFIIARKQPILHHRFQAFDQLLICQPIGFLPKINLSPGLIPLLKGGMVHLDECILSCLLWGES